MKISTIITLALAGVAVTLLLTTEKGRDYQETALDSAKKLGKKLRRTADNLAEQAPELRNKMEEALS